jgi:hypothetical protein
MFTIYLVEDRVAKNKTLVISDKRFSSFVADITDRKTKNIEEIQSSPDLAYLQSRIPHLQKTYKIEDKGVKNPHKIKMTSEDRRRLRMRKKSHVVGEEGRKNMSAAKTGEKNPMFGRKQSARSNAINRRKRLERLVQPHAMPHRQESKDKYRESRKKWKPNVGKKWAYDPYTLEEKFVDSKNPLPPGWMYGRSPSFNAQINKQNNRGY